MRNVTMDVTNRVAVIPGSAQGLGKAFAASLLEAGARVCLSDISQDAGQKTLAELAGRYGEGRVCFQVCDVTSEEEFRKLYEGAEGRFGGAGDILVNNAGNNNSWGWRKCLQVGHCPLGGWGVQQG